MHLLRLLARAKTEAQIAEPNKETYILFIDLKAAFDNVDHAMLFEKMKDFGIKEPVINSVKFI